MLTGTLLKAAPVTTKEQREAYRVRREQQIKQQTTRYRRLLRRISRVGKVRKISDAQWVTATEQDDEYVGTKATDWNELFLQFSDVMRLIHLAARQDHISQDDLRRDLLSTRRSSYENELTEMATRLGCDRQGIVGEGDILSTLNTASSADAAGIVNTYNYDLATAIQKIREKHPRANRHVYASKLREWEDHRNSYKAPMIATHTVGTARARAQRDFFNMNGVDAYAVLMPKSAKCPICAGWIARGQVPIKEATNQPPPYHPNCPHWWDVVMTSTVPCEELWLGQ